MKHSIFIFLLTILMSLVHSTNCYAFLNRDAHLLTMQDGLADNKVNCIYKDKDGFMWFGTDNGLSHYDGSSIKSFTLESDSYTNISAIDGLSEHCLGIIVGKTLYGFNRLTEKFIPVETEAGKIELVQFIANRKNKCWIVSSDKLCLYDVHENKDDEGSIVGLTLNLKEEIKNITEKGTSLTRCSFSADKKEIYLTNNRLELLIYDVQEQEVTKNIPFDNDASASVSSILDYDNIIWISTKVSGIVRYHKHQGRIDYISYGGKGKENLLSHPDVYDLIPINNNRLLAVTWNGYTILIPKDDSFEELTTSIYNNVSIINQNLETRMICVYYDRQGMLWVGTQGGGVIFSDLRLQYFNQFHQDRHNEICGITADANGYIWLATFHKGIMKSTTPFNPLDKFEFVAVGNDEVRKNKTVLCLLKDVNGNIWFGNKDGTLTVYDKEGTFKVHTLNIGTSVNSSSVWALHIDSNNNFWVGTDNGLLLFDPVSGKCRCMEAHDKLLAGKSVPVRAIAETHDGKIWVGTEYNGLGQVIGEKTLSFGYGISLRLQNASVKSLLASCDGLLYIGYENGLGVMDAQKETMESFYTTQNGLCNNTIGCIAEDAQGQIWVGSNSGISRYSRHQKLFYHYYISGSNRSAFLYGENLFWGNNKSLTYFNPQHINAFPFSETAAITTLEVGNRTVGIGERVNGQTILHNSLFYTKEIKLNHDNRDFSLTFSSLSYSQEQQKFRYRLHPYQAKWMVADRGEKVSYANLRTGKYTFEIQNLYPDERMGKITSLTVTILPHWSETFLFKLVLLVLAVLIVLGIINRIKVRQKRLGHELQLEHEVFAAKVERDKEKQIRLERENFFTNASHELRTPLTLILSPLQELLAALKPSDAIYEKLTIMFRNVSSLHMLVDHLLYVQKIEAGMVKLRLSKADIVELVKGVALSFRQMADTKEFDFVVELPQYPVWLWIDVEKITSAIRNLLSNAFKYTSPKGNITLSMDRVVIDENSFCKLVVSDTGQGIPEELQERIFDSFITGDNVPLLSTKVGIGLRIVKNTIDLHHGVITLKSSPGKGSTFTLFILEGNTHFKEDKYELVGSAITEEMEIPFPVVLAAGQEERNASKKSLLIIEDNEEVRAYVCSLFYRNYIIYEAANGEEGIEKAVEMVPSLIISDVMMPVKDGFTCCREIREDPRTAHIPILMLTAKDEDADILHSSKVGADDYMRKPFNPEVLKSKVANLILQRERLKRIYTKTLMLKQNEAVKNGTETDDFIQQIVQVIEANLSNESFNVKMLAEQLNMSQPTLYRKIKQRSELAAIEIIRSIRMSKAATLIMENRYSIQEIAEMVGYSDTRTLRKHFTEQFGVSPSKYMEKTEV